MRAADEDEDDDDDDQIRPGGGDDDDDSGDDEDVWADMPVAEDSENEGQQAQRRRTWTPVITVAYALRWHTGTWPYAD